jgi:hypothetical protein
MIQYFKKGSKVYFKEGKYQGQIGEVIGDDCILLTVTVKVENAEIVEVPNLILQKDFSCEIIK